MAGCHEGNRIFQDVESQDQVELASTPHTG